VRRNLGSYCCSASLAEIKSLLGDKTQEPLQKRSPISSALFRPTPNFFRNKKPACPAQDVKPTDLGKGAAFNGKKIEMKDKGEVAYLLSFTAGKEFEATTDGLKNTDVHLFVYDSSGAEVAKDDSPGPKCSVKVTPEKDGQYKFVIKNAGGANTVTFNVKVAK
jgi:hypothetical protein